MPSVFQHPLTISVTFSDTSHFIDVPSGTDARHAIFVISFVLDFLDVETPAPEDHLEAWTFCLHQPNAGIAGMCASVLFM